MPKQVNVLFVIPPYFNLDDFISKDRTNVLPAFTMPYGVLSLDAYIKARCEASVETAILDLNVPLAQILGQPGVSQDQVLAMLNNEVAKALTCFQADIVGVSALFNSSFRYIEDIATVVKQALPNVLVTAGGGLPSAAFDRMLGYCPSIDAVCKGEGEIPLADLIDTDDRSALLESHQSWITRSGLAVGKQPGHTFVQNLDDIPPLDYRTIDLNHYNSRSIDKRYIGMKKREMAIHTSRGCPFLCVFCSNPSLHGRAVRTMSVDRVEAEVKRMRDEFGLTVLMIEDDHFFHDKERAKDVLRRLIDLDIRIEFPNGVAVYAIDDEVAELFAKAGVSTVALAVESGSDYVLDHLIKKPLKKKLIKPAVEALRRHGVQSHVFIVIGLPGEMDEHRQETLEMMIDSGFDWAHIYCAIPIFGSRLYDICADNGYIENSNPLDFINTKSVIRAPGVDPDAIADIAYHMNLVANFVENHNMKIENYSTAIKYFKNVCEKYPDHAFGQYFLGMACKLSGMDLASADKCMKKFNEIVASDEWWRSKAVKYGLLKSPVEG
ncbi:B12 binding domain-containing protein [Mariprofundus ferrinatatus]|uniref:B12 binding domain-containing protein n=1 Tax=Mariprofundus ferrinatatus TaxID=1921087 RepID=A0A2K8L9P3_9PROT|nr:radical SAM protein [Mariprofundus ferrinatatus]ATX82969.1 B12 binding domain-containing protein [Mariprofundus ferrinatatus]